MKRSQWRPISKAPRDGTPIIVTETPNGMDWNVMYACWMAHGADNVNPNDNHGAWWSIYPSRWSPSEGRLFVRWRPIQITPVCWQPMPKADPVVTLRRRLAALVNRVTRRR